MSEKWIGENLEVRLVDTADPGDIKALYEDAGWWKPEYNQSQGFLQTLPRDSALFAGAFDKTKMIGMGRALSDLKSDAYIQDVAVLRPYRGQGMGSRIIQTLIQGLEARGVDWIGLIGEPGTGSFYRRLGFREMTDYIPFKLKR
jgi:spermidine synthase